MDAQLPPVLASVTAGDGGASFVLRALRAADPSAPVTVILPAMGTPARFYAPFAHALHGEGLSVVTVDLRGQGESAPRTGRGVRFGYREIVEVDLPAVLAAVRGQFPGVPLVLLGHSLGGQLGLLHAATTGERVDALALIASGSVWYRGFGPLLGPRNLVGSQLIAGVCALRGHWPGRRLGFGGDQPGGVMRDWARQARTGRYTLDGSSVDYESALRALALPLLMVGVDNDALAPAGAREHLLSKVPNAAIDRWQYGEDAAGGKRVDHFRWVRHHAGLGRHVAQWTLKATADSGCPDTERADSGGGRAAESPDSGGGPGAAV
ncbi:alpha/beta fold hydrolase [Streptomyces monticola]|uniref:Alpha/beta fold hydrolase n=1 Tax=Streptomyces monticola TaxID=2666263 RepID=A0ABW2JCQ4_9ACTN